MAYTTRELIDILDREMRSCWRGKRIVLSSEARIDNPVIAKALDIDKVSKVYAYRDFRAQIWAYQQEHQISGIVWRTVKFNELEVQVPEIHNQLVAVEGDKEILMSVKDELLDFWWQVSQTMQYWLVIAPDAAVGGERHQPRTRREVETLVEQTQWAEIDAGRQEVYLGLCWGNPSQYRYGWAKPLSGCTRIVAASDRPSLINI